MQGIFASAVQTNPDKPFQALGKVAAAERNCPVFGIFDVILIN